MHHPALLHAFVVNACRAYCALERAIRVFAALLVQAALPEAVSLNSAFLHGPTVLAAYVEDVLGLAPAVHFTIRRRTVLQAAVQELLSAGGAFFFTAALGMALL